MSATQMLTDSELRLSGIGALNQALGPAGAFRFLSLVSREPTDYVRISRKLYEGQTVDGIMARVGATKKTPAV